MKERGREIEEGAKEKRLCARVLLHGANRLSKAAAFAKRGEGERGREGRRLIICCTRPARPSALDYVRLTARHKSMSERGANERPSPFPRSFCVIGATPPPKPAKSELVRKEGRMESVEVEGYFADSFVRTIALPFMA